MVRLSLRSTPKRPTQSRLRLVAVVLSAGSRRGESLVGGLQGSEAVTVVLSSACGPSCAGPGGSELKRRGLVPDRRAKRSSSQWLLECYSAPPGNVRRPRNCEALSDNL